MTRLPGILGEIEDVAGVKAALQLARARGGTEMAFSARPGGALAQIVGDVAAAKITKLLGRQKFTIPMANIRGLGARRAAVAKLLLEERSITDAARIGDVHERTARRIREKLKKTAGQGRQRDLFDD